MDNEDNKNELEVELECLKKEYVKLNNELLTWKKYTQEIVRLLKTFRNDYVIMQTKCIQNIENPMENQEQGFTDFLRGKLHTITEVINDYNIINHINFVHVNNEIKFLHEINRELNENIENIEKMEKKENMVKENQEGEVEKMDQLNCLKLKDLNADGENNDNVMNFFGVNYVMG